MYKLYIDTTLKLIKGNLSILVKLEKQKKKLKRKNKIALVSTTPLSILESLMEQRLIGTATSFLMRSGMIKLYLQLMISRFQLDFLQLDLLL